jgi:hypothetical protein
MTDTDQPKEFKAHGPEHNSPPRHPCDNPDLNALEFLLAVMHDPTFPIAIRVKAAEGAAPYFTPRPGEARVYPCVDAHLTYIIPDHPRLREALEPKSPDQAPPTEEPKPINGKSQSKDDDDPGDPNFMTTYSTPPTPEDIQQITTAVHQLRPDLAHLPVPEFHLCPCGHWITGSYPCCSRKLN